MTVTDVGSENLRIVKTMLENGLAGRINIVRPYVSEDLTLNLPASIPYGRTYRGWQGYLDVLGEVGKFWKDVSFGPNEFALTEDNKVIVCSRLSGRIAKNDKPLTMPINEIWEIKQGKVVKITAFYYDTKLIHDLAAQ
jgi:ketosteroid isomerase-like protein